MTNPEHDHDTLGQVREARQFHQLLSGAEEAARGDLWEIVERLSEQVAVLQDDATQSRFLNTPAAAAGVERDVRWLDARVHLLEQALTDSRAEVETLRAYIDATAAELRVDIESIVLRTAGLREGLLGDLEDLSETTSELEELVSQLHSRTDLSDGRIEDVATELFEAADRTRNIATDAHVAAEFAAERSEMVALEAREADRMVAMEARQATKVVAAEAREAAADARRAVEEKAGEAREANEEVRVMAEKAKDIANRAANDLAALQADNDLREELDLTELVADIDRLQADVEESSQVLRSELQAAINGVDQRIDAVDEQVRDVDATQRLRAEVEASATSDLDAATMQRQLSELRIRMESLSSTVDQTTQHQGTKKRSVKRWVAHLPTDSAPKPDVLELPVGDSETTDS